VCGGDERHRSKKGKELKRIFATIVVFLALCSSSAGAAEKELEIQGRTLLSRTPPFTLILPAELRLVHSSTVEYPKESSRTRTYFLIREKGKQVEQMMIVQVADRTNPMAEPMSVPPLNPDTDRRTYVRHHLKREMVEVDYLIQLIAWNPAAPSLEPVVKKGIAIPSLLALQGQILFPYGGEHAALIRYSREVTSFGMKVSGKGDDWNRGTISGNEKKVYAAFQKDFMGTIDSLTFKTP
jgi:hypothetical protein